MGPLVFKKKFEEIKWRKPVYIWMSVALGPPFVGGIYALLFTDQWQPGLLLTIFLPFFATFIYKSVLKIETRINRWKTFRIVIEDDSIHRDFNNEPRKTILRSAIHSVVNERGRGVRINGKNSDGLWIPSDMEEFNTILSTIESDLRANTVTETTASNETVSSVIAEEQPPESFPVFIKVLQENFTGISLFTTIIILISYIKIYFYFGLYGINVNNYLDVSEIILAFGPTVKELFILMLLYIGIYRLFEFVKIKEGRPETSARKRLSIFMILIIVGFGILAYYKIPDLIMTFISDITAYATGLVILQIVTVGIAFAVTLFVVSFLYIHVMATFSSGRLVTMASTGAALLVSFLFVILYENQISYGLNNAGRPKYSVTLMLNNQESIMSSNSLTYIGGTVNYYFFHDFKTKENIIVPKNSVTKAKQTQHRIGL
ncbi:hypothetical protein [Parachryseolinea silvisoli]|uniref:hypothetical protein n=1 Tax=Parachryseolinea silvisoli TaxID=2873601 RepID=UPI002265A3DD|nr:hypothetical protein [Parachryseolinea silvisoli]MCD9019153.1 hypothetical protein [Parachryseolinea silvisoli]